MIVLANAADPSHRAALSPRAGVRRGGYGDFGLFDSGLVDGAIEIFELCAFQICFDHQKILT